MSIYSDFALTATELLTEFGMNVVINTTTGETLNPITGATGGSTANTTVLGIFIMYREDNIDGTRIKLGDRKLFINADIEPDNATDTVTVDGEPWQIVEVIKIKPTNELIGTFLQVRR